ncbi:MAG: YdcF family protein [Paracoccaceae bacterium]|nr:YdcF family protein [Paracoccaceae bacterium]
MRLLSLLRALIRLGLIVAALSFAVPLLWVMTYHDPALPKTAQAIVVLSGETGPDGDLGPQTKARVDRGVALWKAGAAPLLMFTGTVWGDGGVISDHMVNRAVTEGVDPRAILLDPDSTSTLQNALFSARILSKRLKGGLAAPVILVSHRYHLPRAWASFRWAGFTNLTLVAADGTTPLYSWRDLGLEVLKIPFNVLRGGAATLMQAYGAPERKVEKLIY